MSYLGLWRHIDMIPCDRFLSPSIKTIKANNAIIYYAGYGGVERKKEGRKRISNIMTIGALLFENNNKSNQNDAQRLLCSIDSAKKRLHRQAIKSKLILTSAQTRTHIYLLFFPRANPSKHDNNIYFY